MSAAEPEREGKFPNDGNWLLVDEDEDSNQQSERK